MSVTLRDYQSEAVEFLVPKRRAFVQAPAGSGKTLIAAKAIARRVKPGNRVLWLANTREQVEQGTEAIRRTGGPQGVEFEVCCVAAQPDASKFDLIIFDEAHHAPASTWLRIVMAARPDAIVWGFSATPFGDDDERNEIVRRQFVEFFQIERKRVEDSGHLALGKVYVHDLDTPGEFDREIDQQVSVELINRCRRFPMVARFEHERRIKWQITQEFIQKNENRNNAAVGLIKQEADKGHSVLALVFSIEHGTELASRVDGGCGLVHSKLGAKARRGFIESFRGGSLRVLFATSLADEGLDVPRASRLVLIAGGRSAGRLEQRAGRVLRPFPGKLGGAIHDFMDAGACFALAQARARFRVYEKLGYAPEIVSYRAVS